MNWYTITGYDDQDVVIHVQASSEDDATTKCMERFPALDIESMFLGKLDDLLGNAELFEVT